MLEIAEVQSTLSSLDVRERTMVLLDVVTGLRVTELFGLKWTDIDFIKNDSCAFLCLRSFGETGRISLIPIWRPRGGEPVLSS